MVPCLECLTTTKAAPASGDVKLHAACAKALIAERRTIVAYLKRIGNLIAAELVEHGHHRLGVTA